jgi:hypothetical protein
MNDLGGELRRAVRVLGRQNRAELLANPSRPDRRRCFVRRFGLAFLAVSLVLLVWAAPAAAATGGGGPGTSFNSDSTSCSTSGGRQVCTDTNLNVFPNGDGTESACVDILRYSIASTGRITVISDETGCALAGTLTAGTDLSVTLASTDVALSTCNRRSCTPSRTVTVSANDTPTSPITTTTTRTTTTVGGCTYRTTTKEQDAEVAGTLTIDESALAESGFVSVVSQTSTVHCH